MRGFRAARAAQNFKSAHFGKNNQPNQIKGAHQGANSPQQQQEKRPLPDWLKIHETPVKAIAVKATPPKPTPVKPNLRLVKTGGRETVAKATVSTKAVTRTKTKTRTAVTAATKKRKVAA